MTEELIPPEPPFKPLTIGHIQEELIELLEKFQKGEKILTIEMGGMGDSYESGIQLTAFEMLRRLVNANPSRDEKNYTKESLDPIINCGAYHPGLSGAQFDAAYNVATRFYLIGYNASTLEFPEDRKIFFSRIGGIERAVTSVM